MKTTYWILDASDNYRPYIQRGWATAEEAEAERADLLAPYPPSSKWHKWLVVLPVEGALKDRRAAGRVGGMASAKKRQEVMSIGLADSKRQSKSVETVAAQ